MAEIAAISGRVSQIPGPLITRGLKRGGVILGALVLAFAVGLAAKKIADLNLREENQTPQAEEVVKKAETYQKAGMELPPDLSLTVRRWARLEPEEFDKKQQALASAWQQYQQAQRLMERVDATGKAARRCLPTLLPSE